MKYAVSSSTPKTKAIKVARPAPRTPSGWCVSQPAISIGASTTFISTVKICTIMVGFTMPVPRSADAMEMSANCKPMAGTNHSR